MSSDAEAEETLKLHEKEEEEKKQEDTLFMSEKICESGSRKKDFLTFQYFSCTNVEITSFQVTKIPKCADNLILAGNISAFAYPHNQHLFEYLSQTWDRVFFVPGPQEFAHGPMDLGRKTCECLEEELGVDSFIVLSLGRPVLFPEYNLRIIGAHLWGPNHKIYEDRRILAKTPTDEEDKKEAKFVNKKQAIAYQEQDCAYIEQHLKVAKGRGEKVIVVTHGCPSYLLCKETSNDQTAYSLPAPVKASLLEDGPDFWIYGATGDKAGAAIESSNTMFCVNDYDGHEDTFRTEERHHVIKIKAPEK